jgi:hypothetical protein
VQFPPFDGTRWALEGRGGVHNVLAAMRFLGSFALLLLASSAHAQSRDAAPPSATVASLPACSADVLADVAEPEYEDVREHRPSPFPVARYVERSRPEYAHGMTVQVGVDATGRVTYMHLAPGMFERKPVSNPQRTQVLERLAKLRYAPFEKEGKPAPASFIEYIDEEDIPGTHRPMPEGPLDTVRIRLERTACLGTCPVYVVELLGSGAATFSGEAYVDVEGKHRFEVAPESVAQLLEKAKAADFWSLRERYAGGITDFPSTIVSIEAGGVSRTVSDYVGTADGMPQAMVELERAIDDVARSSQWITLSDAAVDALVAERFDFSSPAGAVLLMRAIGNDGDARDEGAIVRVIELGAPIGAFDSDLIGWGRFSGSPLEGALEQRLPRVVDALLARGALGSPARPDSRALDAAFGAAIRGGDLVASQRIWNFGTDRRPALTFTSTYETDDGRELHKVSPVILLLDPESQKSSDGLRIAQWLVALGCDPKASTASGVTLLHLASSADDLAMVRWLLSLGADPNALNKDDEAPIDMTYEEQVALALLDSGARPTSGLLHRAKELRWAELLERVKAKDKPN